MLIFCDFDKFVSDDKKFTFDTIKFMKGYKTGNLCDVLTIFIQMHSFQRFLKEYQRRETSMFLEILKYNICTRACKVSVTLSWSIV
jgi:hypothetical protein